MRLSCRSVFFTSCTIWLDWTWISWSRFLPQIMMRNTLSKSVVVNFVISININGDNCEYSYMNNLKKLSGSLTYSLTLVSWFIKCFVSLPPACLCFIPHQDDFKLDVYKYYGFQTYQWQRNYLTTIILCRKTYDLRWTLRVLRKLCTPSVMPWKYIFPYKM